MVKVVLINSGGAPGCKTDHMQAVVTALFNKSAEGPGFVSGKKVFQKLFQMEWLCRRY